MGGIAMVLRMLLFLAVAAALPAEEGSIGQKPSHAQSPPHIREVQISPLIAPRTDTLRVDELFRFDEERASEQDNLLKREYLSSSKAPFGEKAGYIPFWQLSDLFGDLFSKNNGENTALVGRGSFYLPPDMQETEKRISLEILEYLCRQINDDVRVEIELDSVPESLPGLLSLGDYSDLRAEKKDTASEIRVESLPGGQLKKRFALYHREHQGGEHPLSVIGVSIRYYSPGFTAARDLPKGTELDTSSVQLSPVEINPSGGRIGGRIEVGSSGKRPLSHNRMDAIEASFSPAGLSAGYEYSLRRDLRAGEPIIPSVVDVRAPVEGGDRVSCRFKKGRISLTIEGRALSSGGIGEKIRVRLSSGKKREMWVRGKRLVSSTEDDGI